MTKMSSKKLNKNKKHSIDEIYENGICGELSSKKESKIMDDEDGLFEEEVEDEIIDVDKLQLLSSSTLPLSLCSSSVVPMKIQVEKYGLLLYI